MKNNHFFPVERNHYYYGKLLAAEDFELEQRYMNNKRRLLNRLLYGSGVVRGMEIVQVDDETLSLEAGLALDYAGREIIVERPASIRLSELEGFYEGDEEELPYAYLCIAYEEQGKEAVYNVAGASSLRDNEEAGEGLGNTAYNKWREGYRLYLSRSEPPVGPAFSGHEMVFERQICFQGNGIRISQWLPRFVKAGETAELLVEVENLGQQQDFAFSYEISLQLLKYSDRSIVRVDFDEHLVKKSRRYYMSFLLSALEIEEGTGCAAVREESFHMSVGGSRAAGMAAGLSQTRISRKAAFEALLEDHFKSDMETVLEGMAGTDIYLAKILFLRAGETFVIQETEWMPFQQYVWSGGLGYASYRMGAADREGGVSRDGTNAPESKEQSAVPMVRFGSEKISFGSDSRKGKVYFSGEIVHGLGIGEVCIQTGSIHLYGQKEMIYGKDGIFRGGCPRMDMAVKVFPDKGTFVIGVKLLDTVRAASCMIAWTGWRNPAYEEEESTKKEILLPSEQIILHIRESCYLEAVCKNMADKRLKWDVEKEGGMIDSNGMYVAPDRPGVYRVTASSLVYPDVESGIYIVVQGGYAI